ncbi:MAG: hypothetical protein ACM3TT_12830 [Syntrophothermus sp.]
MKKLLVALTFALTLVVASTAFAQTPPVGPKIGGDLTSFMSWDNLNAPMFWGRLRLTIAGDVNNQVSYAARLADWFVPDDRFPVEEGSPYAQFFDYGFASFKNIGPAERIDVGAIPVNRSPLRRFDGVFNQVFRLTGAMATSRLNPNTEISLGIGPISDGRELHGNLLADLQYKTSFGDFGVGAVQLYKPSVHNYSRLFSVRAAVPVMEDKARIYGEVGASQIFELSPAGVVYQEPDASAIIGVSFPRLARATGYVVAGEYNLTGNILGWQVARNLTPGVTVKTEGDYEIGSNSGHNLTTQTSLMVSF